MGIAEISEQVRRGVISPAKLTKDCLHNIEKLNPTINAFITVTAESALSKARAAEAEIQAGRWRDPLHGIPIALKDLIDTAGVKTTAASALFKDRVPPPRLPPVCVMQPLVQIPRARSASPPRFAELSV